MASSGRAGELGIAPKGSEKYVAQTWAGLVDDPETLAAERARRAEELHRRRVREVGEATTAALERGRAE